MLYSRSTQYAIRAMAFIASQPRDAYIPVKTVAQATQVPLPFLAKILQNLARRGLLASYKGRGGGVALSAEPEKILLQEIVHAIDGQDLSTSCVLGLARCSDTTPCAVHEVWKGLRQTLLQTLHVKTLADIATARPVEGSRLQRPSRTPARRAAPAARPLPGKAGRTTGERK